jgi:hypothetical protein
LQLAIKALPFLSFNFKIRIQKKQNEGKANKMAGFLSKKPQKNSKSKSDAVDWVAGSSARDGLDQERHQKSPDCLSLTQVSKARQVLGYSLL